MVDEKCSAPRKLLADGVIVLWTIGHARVPVSRKSGSMVVEIDSTLTGITGHSPIKFLFVRIGVVG